MTLSHEQFKIAYEGESDLNSHTPEHIGWHSVVARDPYGDVAGVMHWSKKKRGSLPAGNVDWVEVDPSHQRQGLATKMWEHANEIGVRPSPKHSPDRTDKGDAWARAVGGRLPRRKDV